MHRGISSFAAFIAAGDVKALVIDSLEGRVRTLDQLSRTPQWLIQQGLGTRVETVCTPEGYT